MALRWDELTAHDFPAAVDAAKGTCLLPIGCLERHGDHLPIGTDAFIGGKVAEAAAKIEPVVVFPTHIFGQINEAKGWPGAVALRREVLLDLLDNVCEEIARNGLRKIVILNSHGGNETFLDFFAMTRMERQRPYTLYLLRLGDYWGAVTRSPAWREQMESEFDSHGGEAETSLVMAARPELVRMDHLGAPGLPQHRLGDLGGMVKTPMFWYADFPDYYAGDAAAASEEKGAFLVRAMAEVVARALAAVKDDRAAPALEQDFYDRLDNPRNS